MARRRSLAIPLACLALGLAIVVSGTFLESTIFPRGTIVGTTRRAAALDLFRIAVAAMGVYLLIRRPRLTAVHLAALAVAGGVATVVAAAVLQVVYVPPPVVSGWRSLVPAREQNEFGFRGRQIQYSPGDYVVVLLGDSQVEAAALAFDAMPERVLEAGLDSPVRRTKVFSIGTGGYGQDQELLALQQYLTKYRADLVVLWQTQGNDVWNNVFNTHMANRNPKPTFWLDGAGGLQGPSEALGGPLASSPVVVAALWQRAFGLPWRDKSWERNLPPAYVPMDRYEGAVRDDWQTRWDTNLGRMRDEELDTEKSHMSVMLTPRSPRMQYGLNLTRALTRRIQETVASGGGRLVVFQADTHDFVSEGEQVYELNGKYYRVSKQQYDANWNFVNAGLDLEVVPVTVKDWRVSPEDGHLNTQATAQVIAELARRVRVRLAERPPS